MRRLLLSVLALMLVLPMAAEDVEITFDKLPEKAQKVVVDGVLYIIRDNKMFNVQGAQVR